MSKSLKTEKYIGNFIDRLVISQIKFPLKFTFFNVMVSFDLKLERYNSL